jgi:hypothetical protein
MGNTSAASDSFLDREIHRQWMAQPLPLAHRRLRDAQIFGRDPMQRDEQVVV